MRWQATKSVRHETLGASTSTSLGTLVESAAPTVKGSWANIGSTTSFTYEALTVFWTQGAVSNDNLLDIGIASGSNRWVLMADLRLCGLKNHWQNAMAATLPLHVPAGSQLSARMAADPGTTEQGYVVIVGHSAGWGGMPGYSRGVALYSSTDCRGVDIECTSLNTKTSWVETSSGISQPVEQLLVACGAGNEFVRAAVNNHLVDVGIGGSGSEQTLVSNMYFSADFQGDLTSPQYVGPMPCHIPASTRVAVRAQGSGNTAGERKIDIALWGFVR